MRSAKSKPEAGATAKGLSDSNHNNAAKGTKLSLPKHKDFYNGNMLSVERILTNVSLNSLRSNLIEVVKADSQYRNKRAEAEQLGFQDLHANQTLTEAEERLNDSIRSLLSAIGIWGEKQGSKALKEQNRKLDSINQECQSCSHFWSAEMQEQSDLNYNMQITVADFWDRFTTNMTEMARGVYHCHLALGAELEHQTPAIVNLSAESAELRNRYLKLKREYEQAKAVGDHNTALELVLPLSRMAKQFLDSLTDGTEVAE